MNIIIVTSARSNSGGVRQALYLAEALVENGYRVSFFTYPDATVRALSQNSSIAWADLPASLWDVNAAILKAIDMDARTVVHAFHSKAVKQLTFLGTYWRLKKLPITCVAHRGVTSRPGNPLPYLLPGIRAFMVNSQCCADKLPFFMGRQRVHLVNNSIPEERIIPRERPESVKSRLGIPGEAVVLGAIAEDKPEKGVEQLLRGYALVKQSYDRPLRLVIVGGTWDRWGSLCDELGIADEVIFVTSQDVADYLQIFTLFVVASYFIESQPNVILEAMSMGLPVLATNVGGIPELLDEACLFPPRDIAAMAEKITWMLGDEDARSKAARENHSKSKLFTTENRMQTVLRIYRDVVAEH